MAVKVDYANAVQDADLDTLYLTGAGYVNYPFKGVDRDSAWGREEATWGGDLYRSQDFVLTNVDEVNFGLVARCEISYKYMNAQDYFALCKIAKQRTCTANFFNRDTGERVTQEMAFTERELDKLYGFGQKFLGGNGVSIKLVATNRDKAGLIQSTVTISYDANGGSGTIDDQTATWSDAVILADGTAFTNSGYSLASFNTSADGTGWKYLPNQHITAFGDLKLYAIWE